MQSLLEFWRITERKLFKIRIINIIIEILIDSNKNKREIGIGKLEKIRSENFVKSIFMELSRLEIFFLVMILEGYFNCSFRMA